MCGILVALGFEPPQRALDLIAHRGPDGSGWARFDSSAGPVALGNRRLAIVDLTARGNQPMRSADGRYTVTYNGELYNYRELRSILEAEGRRFRTASDTEVLLEAFAYWGDACLDRFNGMFAFAIWDDREKYLFAARDRFGIKPLYWRAGNGQLAVASEIKQFTVLPGFAARANDDRLIDFLAWGLFDHTGDTMFRGVQQLRGGECFYARAAEDFVPRIARWYELPRGGDFSGNAEEAAGRLRALLEDSISLRLRSDVPVASCLSGGIDSSGVVCLLESLRAGGDPASGQFAFSAIFDDPDADERRFVDIVDAATTVDVKRVSIHEDELTELANEVMWHQDEPFGGTSLFAQWFVFLAAARAGLKVMLDGQGADELFAGYLPMLGHFHAGLLRRGRLPQFARALAADRRRHRTGMLRQLALTVAALGGFPLLRAPLRWIGHPAAAPWIRGNRLGAGTAFERAWRARLDGHPAGVRDLCRSMILDTSLPMLLHYEDRNAMAHGIEARVPYLDYRLVEFAISLPADMLVRDGRTKWILRQSLRGAVPDAILERDDKIGFATPERRWMGSALGKWCREQGTQALERRPDLFDRRFAKSLVTAEVNDLQSLRALWRLAQVEVWHVRFGVG